MERSAPPNPPKGALPSRPRTFLLGALGLPLGVVVAVAVEALLAGDGRVSRGFFVAAAVVTPVLGLGLLVQVVATLAGTTRGLLRELKRFNEEMAAEPPALSVDSQRERRVAWERARNLRHVLAPLLAGLALQLVVAETAAIYCMVAGVEDRFVAVALGVQILALFHYVLFFTPLLARLSGAGARAAVT